jgi:hypothetical protein
MRRYVGAGDGDICPLESGHGQMFVIRMDPPLQFCSHVAHDGWRDTVRTRALWPLYMDDATKPHSNAAGVYPQIPDLTDLTVEAW